MDERMWKMMYGWCRARGISPADIFQIDWSRETGLRVTLHDGRVMT